MTARDGVAHDGSLEPASDADASPQLHADGGAAVAIGRSVRLTAPTNYGDVIDRLFLQQAIERGCTTFVGSHWISGRDPVEAGFDRIASATYDYNGAEEILARFDDGLAHVIVREGSVAVRAAAADRRGAERVTARVREQLPPDASRSGHAQLTLWWWQSRIAGRLSRQLRASPWPEAAPNYAAATRAALGSLMNWQEPPRGGRLLLWHGEPGTGKTHAIRSVAAAWSEWASVHVVTDPEELLTNSSYLLEVIANKHRPDTDTSQWRLVVLEDAGEFLAPDAKAATGQALGRLLNIADGALGEALNTLVLITTNEPIRRLHPAVSRPGRCLSEVAFACLDRDEIVAWSHAHEVVPPPWSSATIAELYARTWMAGRLQAVRVPQSVSPARNGAQRGLRVAPVIDDRSRHAGEREHGRRYAQRRSF